MKRILTFVFAVGIAGFSFGQTASKNPLVSERNYKHPFAAAAARKANTGADEKFVSEKVEESNDYKHPNRKATVNRTRVRQGDGVNPAEASKHPFGS